MATIDTSKIAGYAEMSAEDKIKALESFELSDNSAELKRMKDAVTKANGEAAEWKRKHKELLSEDERRQQEALEATEAMKKELEELRRDKVISSYKASYLALGYDESSAVESATAMADGDMTKVFANQQKFQESLAKSMKAETLKGTPRPGVGSQGNVDYTQMLNAAYERGDQVAIAYYTRLIAQESDAAE